RIAHDGIEALALCIKQPPDVILCDVQMPRMDGWQFLRVIRARAGLEKVPFLFLTTLGSEADRLKGYRLGVDGYIPKPYGPAEVVARADRAIARAERSGSSEPESSILRGDLEQVGLGSLLSFLDLEKKTGVVRIAGREEARVYLRGGSVMRVEID